MGNKKIKVFLGGYINSINAQNLNCRSLAIHLDKDKFEVGVMTYPGGSLSVGEEFCKVKKFHLLCKLYRPLRFVRYLTYLRGIIWCDVAYLPKGEIFEFCQKIARAFGKKTFITVEGVIDKESYDSLLKHCGSQENIVRLYNGYDKTFSITKFMFSENSRLMGIKSDGVLYLGVEGEQFRPQTPVKKKLLNDIIFIGSDLKRKRINEFLDLAIIFPNIRFHIVGGDPSFAFELEKSKIKNVIFHGRLSHDDLSDLLSKMDIHVFPSRSEGFPKVTLETAAAGVPSIVYSDYGASEWITTGKDGFVVEKFEEIVDIIKDLESNPAKLQELSENAINMARRFDWKNTIKDWEKVIQDLNNKQR